MLGLLTLLESTVVLGALCPLHWRQILHEAVWPSETRPPTVTSFAASLLSCIDVAALFCAQSIFGGRLLPSFACFDILFPFDPYLSSCQLTFAKSAWLCQFLHRIFPLSRP